MHDSSDSRPAGALRSAPRHRWRRTSLRVGLLGGAAVAVGAWAAGSMTPANVEEGDEARALRVVVRPLEVRTGYDEQRHLIGRVEAARTTQVAGELGGRVVEMLVDEGESVKAGTVVARLDRERLTARRVELVARRDGAAARLDELEKGPRVEDIEVQSAELQRLDAAARLAKSTAERVQKAFDQDAVALQEWDDARLRAEQAAAARNAAASRLSELRAGTRTEQIDAQRAAVAALDASIAALDVDLAKLDITVPFDGRVSARFVDEGAVLEAGRPLLELRESGAREIRVGVPPSRVEQLSVGDVLSVRTRGRLFEATVAAIREDRDAMTRTVPVLLRSAAAAVESTGESTGAGGEPRVGELRDGELVEVLFERRVERAGFWVPTSALSEGVRGLWRCFIVVAAAADDEFALEARTVEVVHAEADRAFARGALQPGDRLVLDGVHRLVPGLRVEPVVSSREGE